MQARNRSAQGVQVNTTYGTGYGQLGRYPVSGPTTALPPAVQTAFHPASLQPQLTSGPVLYDPPTLPAPASNPASSSAVTTPMPHSRQTVYDPPRTVVSGYAPAHFARSAAPVIPQSASMPAALRAPYPAGRIGSAPQAATPYPTMRSPAFHQTVYDSQPARYSQPYAPSSLGPLRSSGKLSAPGQPHSTRSAYA